MSGRRLSTAQVARIRWLLGEGWQQFVIAMIYGVSESTVSRIAAGQTHQGRERS